MAFAISFENGKFWLRGNFTANNATLVRKHFELIFQTQNEAILHLGALDKIDTASVFEIQKLLKFTNQRHLNLSITGTENPKLKGKLPLNGMFFNLDYLQSA
ncbi:MAG: hypothetical protein ABGW76_08170 [Mesonia sp.]|uniref:hypothetical protein n=1 Tax=Mesonia sp. TaxID=1960830 RepID=UPI0032420B03